MAGEGEIDCTDCWPTYAHDYQRTGFQNQDSGITSSNVGGLTERWAWPLNEQVVTSPVVDDGMLFVATGAGNVYAFNASNGTSLWSRNLGGPILETPTIDHGNVYVGTHHAPSSFFALNAATGSVVWQVTVPGVIRGPAAVSQGTVYVGEAGGDPPVCDPGGVHGYQAATGAQIFFWRTDSKPLDGGAVWTPITVDGGNVVFGTGNTCTDGNVNANSLIRLTYSGAQEWEVPIDETSVKDDDWGGSVTVSNGRYYAVNKDGLFDSIDPLTGKLLWTRTLSPIDGEGSIGTPTTDGSVVIVPSGNLLDAHDATIPTANFSAFTTGGSLLWSFPFGFLQRNYAPISNGVAYLAEDDFIKAVNENTGQTLWSYESAGGVEFIGAPAITSVGLFTVDTDGAVILFAPSASSTAERLSIPIHRGQLKEPFGPIVTRSATGANVVRFNQDFGKP